jgi:cell division transport system permease protein
MIAAFHFALPQQLRLDLPLRRDDSARFLPWIIALMVYLAAIGGVALIWLGDALHAWNSELATTWTLEVPADATATRIELTLGALRQTRGLVSARLLEPAETAKLLEPWLGTSIPIDTLPLPKLIDIRVDPNTPVNLAMLHQQLDSIVPYAQLEDNASQLGGMRKFALRAQGVIGAAVFVAALLIVTIVVFTARIGLAIHRSVIELLHLLGAPDAYIARQFQIHALWLGLRGGIIGAIAAAMTVGILGPAGHMLELPMPARIYGLIDWRVWLLLIATLLGAGGVAMVTARIAVLRQLTRMP